MKVRRISTPFPCQSSIIRDCIELPPEPEPYRLFASHAVGPETAELAICLHCARRLATRNDYAGITFKEVVTQIEHLSEE